jgi:type III restriction enzyme
VPRYETSRGPGSTADVDYWTSRDVREVTKSQLNYVVADTGKWEQQAAYILDTHPSVVAFAKNAGLGFGIPYIHNGQPHDYVPDFLVRLKTDPEILLILETKGFDELADIKAAAAERGITAVNADGQFGRWQYAMVRSVAAVRDVLDGVAVSSAAAGPRT